MKDADDPDLAESTYTVAADGGNFRNVLLKFDLSSLPKDIYILRATLFQHHLFSSNNLQLSVYDVDPDAWKEGYVTWNNQPENRDRIGAILLTSNCYYYYFVVIIIVPFFFRLWWIEFYIANTFFFTIFYSAKPGMVGTRYDLARTKNHYLPRKQLFQR
jgi:hypothetical protein